jgi:hypothetical protein
MELTDNQIHFIQVAMTHPEIAEHIRDFWLLYDDLRERGELPKIDANPHVDTGLFALVGYPFSVRGGLAEMQANLENVIEKLSGDVVESVWLP